MYENKEQHRDIKIQESLPIDEMIAETSEVEKEIKGINLLETSPIEALNLLYKIQEKIKNK